MIIKVELIADDGTKQCMMFGNGYKKWHQQLYEYLCQENRDGVRYRRYGLLEQSRAKWIGGCKWWPCDTFDGYYTKRTGKDGSKIKFGMPSETTLVKFEDILGEVAELNLSR